MIALTKKTDYALIALSHLAGKRGCVVSAREIAKHSGVPRPILTNILKALANAGIIWSARGASGGYGVAKRMENVSLHRLITAIEGPFQLAQCTWHDTPSNKGPCELEPSCPIRRPVHAIHGRMKVFLESISVAEIVDAADQHAALRRVNGNVVLSQDDSVREQT